MILITIVVLTISCKLKCAATPLNALIIIIVMTNCFEVAQMTIIITTEPPAH